MLGLETDVGPARPEVAAGTAALTRADGIVGRGSRYFTLTLSVIGVDGSGVFYN